MWCGAEPTDSIFYVYKDYLGSLLTFTNETPKVIYEQSFDAWGRYRNTEDWSYEKIQNRPRWMYRGYTGHEHLYGFVDVPGLDFGDYYACEYIVRPHDAFNLINMNGRLYDPVNGRMLSVDNYVQESLGSQGHNRYTYAGNNPLKYTDPSGEFLTGIELVSNIVGPVFNLIQGQYKGRFGRFILDVGIGIINGAISEVNPLDWNMGKTLRAGISLTLFSGTDGMGFGIEAGASAGFGNWRVAEIYAGTRINSTAYGTDDFAFESYAGIGIGLYYQEPGKDAIKKGFSLRNTWHFSDNGTSQSTGSMNFYWKGMNSNQGSLSYENDWLFGLAGDSGDRYRTAALRLETGAFETGFNLFTGAPKIEKGIRQAQPGVGIFGTYEEQGPQYREGIFYVGAGGFRVGINQESTRNIIQNKFAHDNGNRFPIFQVLNTQPKSYLNYSKSRSKYTLW